MPLPTKLQHTLRFPFAEVAEIAVFVTAALVRAHSAATVLLKLTMIVGMGSTHRTGIVKRVGTIEAVTTLPKLYKLRTPVTMASWLSLQEVPQAMLLRSTMRSPVLSPGSIVNSSSSP